MGLLAMPGASLFRVSDLFDYLYQARDLLHILPPISGSAIREYLIPCTRFPKD